MKLAGWKQSIRIVGLELEGLAFGK